MATLDMLCSYGLVSMYSCLEEFVFDLFKTYWWNHPEALLRGKEFRNLRRSFNQRNDGTDKYEEWLREFESRLSAWEGRKLYDGLSEVFRAYCSATSLKAPSTYTITGPDTWRNSIEAIAALRNCLVHRETKVPASLAEFSKTPNAMTFDFNLEEPIKVTLLHLMGVEWFCDTLLTGINLSLVEMAAPIRPT